MDDEFWFWKLVMKKFAENRCQALMVIDNEPIRQRVEAELQALRAAIEECEQQINRHESFDLPAFRQWMAVECADLLHEQRVLEDELRLLRGRLSAIEGLTRHGIKNVAAAFYWFHEIEQEQGAVPPYVQRAWQEVTVGWPESHRAHTVEVGRFDEEDQSTDEEDEGSGYSAEFRNGLIEEPRPEGHEAKEQDQEELGLVKKLKSFFRKIAMSLHPDMAGLVSNRELELWYQAQRAYEERDIVTLEMVLARCGRVGTNCRTLSELREFVGQANVRLAALQGSITGLGRLPSWRFLLLSNPEVQARLMSLRRELRELIRELAQDAALLERALQRIERKADRWLKRRQGMERQLKLL
jgi:hypothetical protein